MKSPMVETASYIPENQKGCYSELQVLKSAAGYYIGTTYTNGEDSDCPGLVEPGSRDSEYYATKEAAEEDLAKLINGDFDAPMLNMLPGDF